MSQGEWLFIDLACFAYGVTLRHPGWAGLLDGDWLTEDHKITLARYAEAVRIIGEQDIPVTKKNVNDQLRHSYTSKGRKQWWGRMRFQLGDRTPAEAWDDGDHVEVFLLAQASRDMIAT